MVFSDMLSERLLRESRFILLLLRVRLKWFTPPAAADDLSVLRDPYSLGDAFGGISYRAEPVGSMTVSLLYLFKIGMAIPGSLRAGIGC